MIDDDEWDAIRPQQESGVVSSGSGLRAPLLIAACAIVGALVAVPLVNNGATSLYARTAGPGIDKITTATIREPDAVYTVRRSVLQSKPTDVCIIRSNGMYEGDC